MKSFHDSMMEYKKLLDEGTIKQAYAGILEYMQKLRLFFKNKYPDYFVSGNLYFGYMDMTYFSIVPDLLKQRKLKIAIVFIHDSCRFEIWLGGYNKQFQKKYWELINEKNWNKYHIPLTIEGIDSIIENVLVEKPNFNNLDKLTKQIEKESMQFINDVQQFLSDNE